MHDVIALLVACAAALYAVGAIRLWRHAGIGRGVARREVLAFVIACASVVVTLAAPFDEIADASFAAHMVQHETLMIVAAPLFVVAHPLAVWLWALPSSWRASLANSTAVRMLAALWRTWTRPVVATCVQIAALWVWHVPRLFDAALREPSLHIAQHASFFVAALAFWTAIAAPHRRRDDLAQAILLFVTMLATGALGALLTFAQTPWYAPYADSTLSRSWTPLEEQQLGGLIMWIPGGLPYIAAALWALARALRLIHRRPSLA